MLLSMRLVVLLRLVVAGLRERSSRSYLMKLLALRLRKDIWEVAGRRGSLGCLQLTSEMFLHGFYLCITGNSKPIITQQTERNTTQILIFMFALIKPNRPFFSAKQLLPHLVFTAIGSNLYIRAQERVILVIKYVESQWLQITYAQPHLR